MKECSVCGAVSFDDAQVCYGCLHRFAPGEGVRQDLGMPGSAKRGEGDAVRDGGAAHPAAVEQAPPLAAKVLSPKPAPPAGAVREPMATPQAAAVNAPVSQAAVVSASVPDIVLRIEVVGVAVGACATEPAVPSSRSAGGEVCALLRRTGAHQPQVTSRPAEEQRGALAGRKVQGSVAPVRERARHAVRDEHQVVVA